MTKLGKGYDASFSPPNEKKMYAAGYRYVFRYVSPNPEKNLYGGGEFERIKAAKLGLMMNWEHTAGDALRGTSGGKVDGAEAVKQCKQLGYPKGYVIWFSVGDFDAQPNQFATILKYCNAAKAIVEAAGYKFGVYGARGLLKYLKANGIKYFWQICASWGFYDNGPAGDNKWPYAHFWQTKIELDGFGGNYDINIQNLDCPIWIPGAKPATTVTPTPQPTTPNTGETVVFVPPTMARYNTARTNSLGTRMVHVLERYYPKVNKIKLTSGTDGDHGGTSHHYGLSYNGSPTAAIDLAGLVPGKSEDMRDLAKWLYDNFSAQCVELIHKTPFDTDNGFFVKNGRKIGSYGTATDNAHEDHIHWATSSAMLAAMEARLAKNNPNRAPKPPAPVKPGKFPLPTGHYFGLITGPEESHGGINSTEKKYVTQIQRELQRRGFAPKASAWADGLYEAATEKAVKAFQKKVGFTVDGRVGLKTWNRMFN